MYAQAYFAYDSKKSGGITMSHLRFGKSPITSPYLINNADFISCSQQSYVFAYNLLAGLKKGGTFLLNTTWSDADLSKHLPAYMKRYIAQNDIKFYTVNAVEIAKELGLGGRVYFFFLCFGAGSSSHMAETTSHSASRSSISTRSISFAPS